MLINYGPFFHDGYWQLDGSNDYFLREEGTDKVTFWWRYSGQAVVGNAVLALFDARHGNK